MAGAVVPRLWPNSTIVCLGNGPSLTPEDVEFCRGKARVIAINDTYRLAPWADVLYGADSSWWKKHGGVPTFTGLKYTLQTPAAKWPGVKVLANTGEGGLERDPRGLRTGRNGGYQAINLAVHLGAHRIVLLGYDMGAAKDGRQRWFAHGGQPRSPYHTFLALFPAIVKPLAELQIEVINCSRATALKIFPRQSLTDVFQVSQDAVA